MSFWDSIKETNPTIDFYEKFIKIGLQESGVWDDLKEEYFAKQLSSKLLYKFISFGDDELLNKSKLSTLEEKCLWFAPHHVFADNDPTEFVIQVNVDEVVQNTECCKESVEFLLTAIRDVNDICCLTDRISEYMWENYANFHSGICCVFNVVKTNDLWPILYCDKDLVDFTKEVIDGLRDPARAPLSMQTLSFISPVLKDKELYNLENEVRLLNDDAYVSAGGPLSGWLEPNKKKSLHYLGRKVPWNSYGLDLKKIIIGTHIAVEIENLIRNLPLNCIIEKEQ